MGAAVNGIMLMAYPSSIRYEQVTESDRTDNYFRGRIQAQGNGLERSVAWAQNAPPSVDQGLQMLEALKTQLSPRQLNERTDQFGRAERFIINAGNSPSGVMGPFKQSFGGRENSAIRVDIDVFSGNAFVP